MSLLLRSHKHWCPDTPDTRSYRAQYERPPTDHVKPIPSPVVTVGLEWEGVVPKPSRLPRPQSFEPDVLPTVSQTGGSWEAIASRPYRSQYERPPTDHVKPIPSPVVTVGLEWEGVVPKPSRLPRPQSFEPDVLPTVSQAGSDWEVIDSRAYRLTRSLSSDSDALSSVLQAGSSWEPATPKPWQKPLSQADLVEVYPYPIILVDWGSEATDPRLYRIPWSQFSNSDVLPTVSQAGGGWEAAAPRSWQKSWPQSDPVETYPYPIMFVEWESGPADPKSYQIPRARFPDPDVTPATSQDGSSWGAVAPRSWQKPLPQADPFEVYPYPIILIDWGFETTDPRPYRTPWSQFSNSDVLPAALQSGNSWEAVTPKSWQKQWSRADHSETYPYLIFGGSGWEGSLPSKLWTPSSSIISLYTIPPIFEVSWGWEDLAGIRPRGALQRTPPAEVFALVPTQPWGWEAVAFLQFRTPLPSAILLDVLPTSIENSWGWEASQSDVLRGPHARPPIADVLPGTQPSVIYPWGYDVENRSLISLHRERCMPDDWWPPITVNRVLPGGGYKPWYGWGYPEIYEDDDLRERLKRELHDIDEKLAALADDEEGEEVGRKVVVPEVMPPGWRDDEQGSWRRETRDRQEERRRREQQDRYRHVHYNFASDLDFGVRRRIVGILDRAEHRRVDIFGSEAFRTCETALVKGRFVAQGTNAWVVRLDRSARLAIAREAVAEGFKLLSFDDTSLSFIHLPTFPWKPVLFGAGAGATIMGAGVLTGYFIWGHHPKK